MKASLFCLLVFAVVASEQCQISVKNVGQVKTKHKKHKIGLGPSSTLAKKNSEVEEINLGLLIEPIKLNPIKALSSD